MNVRRLAGLVVLALITAIVAACTCTRHGRARQRVIAFSQCNGAEPWRVLFDRELRAEAARTPQIRLVYADAQNSAARQIADVENFMLQGVDCILISPKESAPLTPVVARAYQKGIPVIVMDRGVNGDQYTSFISGDNVAIGRAAGEMAVKALGGRGNVVEIWGLKGSSAARERHQGFHEIIGKSPDIRVIVQQDGGWQRSNAREVMETALKAHERIDLVYAHNDPMAMGAYLAAKDAGRAQGMRFVGADGNPGVEGGAQAVLDGKLTATFLYQIPGAEGVRQARRVLRGEKVPKRTLLATAIITRQNAKHYVSR